METAEELNMLEVIEKIPIDGLLGGLLKLGLLIVESYRDPTSAASVVLDEAEKRKEGLKAAYTGVRLRDREIQQMSGILEYFNILISNQEAYITEIVIRILEKVRDDIEIQKKLANDLIASINSIEIKKDSIILGKIFKEGSRGKLLGLVPDIFKQPEFHEYKYKYMTPSAAISGKSQIYMDPPWFFILSLGYIMSFLGKSGTVNYYMLPDIEKIITLGARKAIEEILESIAIFENVTSKVLSEYSYAYSSKELLEMNIAYKLASGRVEFSREIPFKIFAIEKIGNAYVVKEIFEIDIYDIYTYFKELLAYLRESGKEDIKFIEILLARAYSEIRGGKGDLEVVALPFMRLLYAAIKGRDYRILLDALYRLQRIEGQKYYDQMSKKGRKKPTILLSKRQILALIYAIVKRHEV